MRHGLDFRAEDCNTLLARVNAHLPHPPVLVTDPDVTAGLIIECGGARLDASATGLLADREAVEARLLALVAPEPLW